MRGDVLLSNVIATQEIHKEFGGVVPELASRSHDKNFIPVINKALNEAGVKKTDIDIVAFTRGPGLMGSLLVGCSFAKGYALALDIPLIEVNHIQGHILSVFIRRENEIVEFPNFPFLSLLVSGGHTQIVVVKDYLKMEIIGRTLDDAAGEAFDKCAKMIGIEYPGGPIIDKLSKTGDENKFSFTKPRIKDLDFSFSGLKTNFLYFVQKKMKEDSNFIEENKNHLAASLQKTIIDILSIKLKKAIQQTGITEIAIGGGVAANSGLRTKLSEIAKEENWKLFLPKKEFTTDNAAMIAVVAYHKYLEGKFTTQNITPKARFVIDKNED